MKQVHGHEVLRMMLSSGKVYSRASLVEEILKQFGAETRFHTCSAEGMTAAELVDFLDSRGKLVAHAAGIQTSPELICNH